MIGPEAPTHVQSNCLLPEPLHNSLLQVGNLLGRCLSDWSFVDSSLELGRLDKFVNDVKGTQTKQLLVVAVFVVNFLIEDILNGRAHEALCVVGPVQFVHDE